MPQLLDLDRNKKPLGRRLTAIAFLDVVGYSTLMGRDDEATVRTWSSILHTIIAPRVRNWHGRIIDRAGDGLFIEFQSALDSVRWAMETQHAMQGRKQADMPIQVRIALHLGDVLDGPDGEVQGDGVNTTARLQAFAEPGGIVVSQAIADAVRGQTGAVFLSLGKLHLKNIAHPLNTFRIQGDDHPPAPESRQRIRRSLAIAAAAAGVLLLVLALHHWHAPQADASVIQPPTPREQAQRLLREARAVPCQDHPCPRTWLTQRDLLQRAIALSPDFADPYADATFTYTNFVSAELSLNPEADLRTAENLATRAAALAPDQALAHEARAAVLRQHPDRLEGALSAYLRSLAIKPNQPSARANAGWMLILLGRPAEGEPYLQAALEMAPNHGRAGAWMNYMGLAELFLGRSGHGADWFRRAIDRARGPTADETRLVWTMHLASALALDGSIDQAHQTIDGLRTEHPAISTRSVWNCNCSKAAGFLAGQAALRRGLVLAGVTETH